jgi:hypothetical protein
MDTEIPIMQYQPSTSGITPNGAFGNNSHQNRNSNGNDNTDVNNSSSSNLLHNEVHVVRYAGRQAVCNFLQSYKCLSILKVSTKIIVFDIQTPMQLAFYALVEHGTYIWSICHEFL